MNALTSGSVIGTIVAITAAVVLTSALSHSPLLRRQHYVVRRIASLLLSLFIWAIAAGVLVLTTFLAVNIIERHRETFPIEGVYEVLGVIHWLTLPIAIASTWFAENRARSMRSNSA